MRYTRGLISFVVIAMLVGVGSLVLSTDHARAQDVCTITIEKVAIPADNTPFNFLLNNIPAFTLMDPDANTEIIVLVVEDVPVMMPLIEDVPPPNGYLIT
jgi:hypothetical protein